MVVRIAVGAAGVLGGVLALAGIGTLAGVASHQGAGQASVSTNVTAAQSIPVAARRATPPIAGNAARVAVVRQRIVSPSTQTISVLCDSVGNDPREWVSTWAQQLSATRDVTVHHYSYVVRNGRVAGTGWSGVPEEFRTTANTPLPPLIIWNFGWPGGTPATALTYLGQAIPQRPDVILYSYGHNMSPANTVPLYTTLHRTLRGRYPAASTLATLAHMTPVPRPGQAAARAQLATFLAREGVPVVDSRRVLPVASLYKDAVHPNYPGYDLLAKRLGAALASPAAALYNPAGSGRMWAGALGKQRVLALRDSRGAVVPYAVATLVRRGVTTVLESDANGLIYTTVKPGTRITMTDGVVTGEMRL